VPRCGPPSGGAVSWIRRILRTAAGRARFAALLRVLAERSDGRQLLYVTPSCEQMWGTPSRVLYMGRNPSHCCRALIEDRRRVAKSIRALTAARRSNTAWCAPDGSVRWVMERMPHVRDRTAASNSSAASLPTSPKSRPPRGVVGTRIRASESALSKTPARTGSGGMDGHFLPRNRGPLQLLAIRAKIAQQHYKELLHPTTWDCGLDNRYAAVSPTRLHVVTRNSLPAPGRPVRWSKTAGV